MASKSIFPDEIMTEILLKLPVKSILRCNTLSKHYYSLIRSKFFIRRHLALARLNDQSIVSPIRSSVRLFDRRSSHIEVLETPPPIVEESLNLYGLVVCGPVEGLYLVTDRLIERFTVWNPSTRDQFIIPRLPRTHTSELAAARLKFHVRICSNQYYAYGFGYDDTTDDYKFVLIYAYLSVTYDVPENVVPFNAITFNVFSVRKGEWRSIKAWSGVVPWDFKSCDGVFSHGACHWVYPSFGDSGLTILAFDMSMESHRFIAFPIVGDEYVWSSLCIVSFNGYIGLVNAQKGVNMLEPNCDSSFDVWVMSEYGVTESWTILYQVKLPDGIGGRFSGIVKDRVYIGKDDAWLDSYGLFSKYKKCYDMLDRGVGIGILIPYEESLVRIIKSVS